MHCDHYVGLNAWARNYVGCKRSVRDVDVKIDPKSGKVIDHFDRYFKVPRVRKVVYSSIPSTYTEDKRFYRAPHFCEEMYAVLPQTCTEGIFANLHRYYFDDGSVVEEFVEKIQWNHGPWYYIALRNRQHEIPPESIWSYLWPHPMYSENQNHHHEILPESLWGETVFEDKV